jgi:hypothetical protein
VPVSTEKRVAGVFLTLFSVRKPPATDLTALATAVVPLAQFPLVFDQVTPSNARDRIPADDSTLPAPPPQ